MHSLKSQSALEHLTRATSLLESLLLASEQNVRAVADNFECIAARTGQVLDLAAAIVACVDDERVRAILPEVQALGQTAQSFVAQRLKATSQIADFMEKQTSFLDQFCHLASGQRSIARQTKILSVLTNIEVANLGKLGAGFQYLAHELDEFSREVVQGSEAVAEHAEQRRSELSTLRKQMVDALPRMQAEFSRIETDLGETLGGMEQALLNLSTKPACFQECVDAIAAEVSSVVAAVQSHDITRQQVEHVIQGLQDMAQQLQSEGDPNGRTIALVDIQAHQLKSVCESTSGWVRQIALCLENIQRVSASDIAGIGSTILESEQRLASQMERMAALERSTEVDDQAIRDALQSLDRLMELMQAHLGDSHSARDRMQLLNFNSMIEARHLGSKAAVMVEISQNIRRISSDWSQMTTRSGEAMDAILGLVQSSEEGFAAFSQDSSHGLRSAQDLTSRGLQMLQNLADTASQNAGSVSAAVAALQGELTSVRITAQRLESCLGLLEEALQLVEQLGAELKSVTVSQPSEWDKQDLEAQLSPVYTTELERQIMRCALYGEPMPVLGVLDRGNDIEFF